MKWSRRRVLLDGALAGMTAAVLCTTRAPAQTADAKHIALTNLHTGEHLDLEYFKNGEYDAAALGKLQNLLRDFRNGEQHAIDPKLLDYLLSVARQVGTAPRFSVISGYRSPQSNALLHARSSGVSQHSLHMQGRAIDVRMAGVDCERLAARAIELKQGGVGYYRASDFVHLDTGPFRTWRG